MFTNAEFGDIYMARDGQENVFCSRTIMNGEANVVRLYRKDFGVVIFHLDGRIVGGKEEENEYDIVCHKTSEGVKRGDLMLDDETISRMALIQYPPKLGKYGEGARAGYHQGIKDALKFIE